MLLQVISTERPYVTGRGMPRAHTVPTSYSYLRVNRLTHRVHIGLIKLAVTIQRQVRRGVAQHVLQRLNVRPRPYRQACGGVPQLAQLEVGRQPGVG